MMLLDAIGIPSSDIEYNLPVQDQDRATRDALLIRHDISEPRLLVAINPAAKWETKLWSNLKFAKLADTLIQQYGANVVFTGSSEDRARVQDIISAMEGKAANLAGETTLRTLAALYEKTGFLVSTDTGPMHIASAVGTPVVALFGPTAPWRTGPFGPDHQIIRVGTECSPCFKRQCRAIRCMEEISVEHVLDGVQKLGL
jgi:lipopolysaccharide heptosyltransferase II